MKENTEGFINIPSPQLHPEAEARKSYSIYYGLVDDDSPVESRASLAMRLGPTIAALEPGSTVLDLGAGKGILEKEYTDILTNNGLINVVTVDIADISQTQLLTNGLNNIQHIQASGTRLPFADNTFASGFSNLAVDFMPQGTLSELHRVIAENAGVHINLHHPDVITPPGIDQARYELQRKIGQRIKYGKPVSIEDQMALVSLKHKQYLADNNILFQNDDQIATAFEDAGFKISDIRIAKSFGQKWWELDMKNGPSEKVQPERMPSSLWTQEDSNF